MEEEIPFWVWIIVGIFVIVCLCLVCCCCCWCFQKFETESESIELHDIEQGNGQRSQNRQNGQYIQEVERGPQQNESNLQPKNLRVEQKNVLHVKLIEKHHMQTPNELFSRHIVNGKITEEKAIRLSNKRGKWFAENIGENTVFENPNQFHLCSIDRLLWYSIRALYVNTFFLFTCRG